MISFNLSEYSIGFIFPTFMIAMTFVITPGGVLALIAEYPLYSVIGFFITILVCLQAFINIGGIEIGT